jgi:serralysin
MNRFHLLSLLVCGAGAFTCTSASAFFHLWQFTEFFSNADGSVQFIELRNTSNNEHFASGAQIQSTSTGKVFTFPGNLASNLTAGKSLLVATPGFGSLQGGVTPDFTLPSTNFFNPAGDTLTLSAGFVIDAESFTSIPTDGVQSRVFPSNTLATNSPTNFSGMSGSVNLAAAPSPTGDYNGNGQVTRPTMWCGETRSRKL